MEIKLYAQYKHCLQKTGRLQTAKHMTKAFLGTQNKKKLWVFTNWIHETWRTYLTKYIFKGNTWNSLRFRLLLTWMLEEVYLLSKKLFSATKDVAKKTEILNKTIQLILNYLATDYPVCMLSVCGSLYLKLRR